MNDWILTALELHEKQLLRYAAWLVDDADKARDIVQEAFLRLCREDAASMRDRLPQWLFTVCRNLAFDLRKKDGQTETLDNAQVRVDENEVALAIQALEQRELLDEILRVMEGLPERQREIVYLRFQCGFSYKEISNLTGLSIGNVGFLIHSAMESIRRRIRPKAGRVHEV